MRKHDIPVFVRITQDWIDNYFFVLLALKMAWKKPKHLNLLM